MDTYAHRDRKPRERADGRLYGRRTRGTWCVLSALRGDRELTPMGRATSSHPASRSALVR